MFNMYRQYEAAPSSGEGERLASQNPLSAFSLCSAPPLDGNCVVTVRMFNMCLMDLGTHTVWQIVNDWSKHPKKEAVSADKHGALTLLQMDLKRRKKGNFILCFRLRLDSRGSTGTDICIAAHSPVVPGQGV